MTHDDFMRLALAKAVEAGERGDVPIGAVLVANDEVIAAAGNEREQSSDPTAHAEMLVLRSAAAASGTWRLDGTTLYVTLEPCAMCAGALLLARISTLVYGASDPRAGAALSLYNIPQDPRLNHYVDITAGVLEGECASLLERFFLDRRP